MQTQASPREEAPAFDVVVLGASAGGDTAFLTILSELPPDFAVPIVLLQHLSPDSAFVDTYGARTHFKLEWARDQSTLAARTLLVCPPRSFMELLPDGSVQLLPCEGGALQMPIDRLLQSAARSFAHRAIGVVLTGMGSDGAAGARELHLAGGQVLVQSEASAQYPEMPRATIAAGAASLVVRAARHRAGDRGARRRHTAAQGALGAAGGGARLRQRRRHRRPGARARLVAHPAGAGAGVAGGAAADGPHGHGVAHPDGGVVGT